jgi:hypothetical protein
MKDRSGINKYHSHGERAILRNLRHMAWERAKGEMASMLSTFWCGGPPDNDCESQFGKLHDAIDQFVDEVEGKGLQE